MLTKYSYRSSFKKKITVVAIWLIAFALGTFCFQLAIDEQIAFIVKIIFLILGLFMIAGILLRCKIARGFTLITLYFIAFYPLISKILIGILAPDITINGILFFETSDMSLFSDMEVFLTNLFWASLVVIPVYFLSNEKAMDIFFIDTKVTEHIIYSLIAVGLIVAYVYFMTMPFLESIEKPISYTVK